MLPPTNWPSYLKIISSAAEKGGGEDRNRLMMEAHSAPRGMVVYTSGGVLISGGENRKIEFSRYYEGTSADSMPAQWKRHS
ncbi:hypothetical protein CEXT_615271 [Caerostris extrusa]|uniref:Uncharacterized protein n=1 Tax=Caerostris extrusa TaxID=172846 RepID=A0AAV4XT51_CAEEX|nr:hypothetical protein CEXT_615271 [Caerostris extrusa]